MNASSRFVDKLAVQYRDGGHAQALQREKHVSKRKQRNRDLEIVFDVDSHKDFVTGFRKRKQQRRKEALKSLEKLQRESRLEERAERREARKEQYNLGEDDNNNNNDDDDDDCGEPTMTRVFEGKEMTSTVKVTAIETEDDIDDRVKRRMLEMNKKKKQEEDEEGNETISKNHKHHKLTKKALSVLTNTKMKLQGKKKFSGSAKQASKGGKKNLSGKDSHRRGKKK